MPKASLLVDGSTHRIALDGERSLLHVLREELGVTAPKYGCGEGRCGACRVLLDGRPVPACITPVADAVGHTVTTTAGLAGPAGLHPVQQAFAEMGVAQCGYCTPGMVVAAAALLDTDPDPDEAAISAALEVNVCRCGTYPQIVRAVRRAAQLAASPGWEPLSPAQPEPVFPRPRRPWDLTDPADRDWFDILPEGLVAVLPPDRVPPGVWSAWGGAWIHVGVDGRVTAFTGKVEVGQGNRTSLAQLVAEEVSVPLDRVRLLMGDTDLCPYDEGTFGSLSTPDAGAVLRACGAAVRRLLVGTPPAPGSRRVEIVEGDAPLTPASSWRTAGLPTPGVRSLEAATGAKQFPSDVSRPGMLHGVVLRPPTAGASLRSASLAKAKALTGVVVVREGQFVGAAAADPRAAVQALAAVQARWTQKPAPAEADLAAHLREHPVQEKGWGGSSWEEEGEVDSALASAPVRFRSTYTTAYLAHVPLEPRAAVAEWEGGRLTVWTGSQRPFGVRREVAEALGLPEAEVRVIVPDTGAGFGGKHSGEVAVEAARLARAAGRPVKVAWTREEEFRWAYFRPAAVIDVESAAGADGTVVAWDFRNLNSGSAGIDTPYEIPNRRIVFQPADSPLRQGSYRALAATANHFARESHMDELAHRLGADPVDFRLRHLGDERLAEVLRTAATRAGWETGSGPSGGTLGIACGLEKDSRVATCVEVRVDAEGRLQVLRVVTAFDCGAVVNPQGLAAQIEGATVMGLGGALFEAVHFEEGRIQNASLSDYRVPRFSDTPPIEVIVLDRRDEPSAGAGETPIVAVAPALANAIFTATGVRLRHLPLVPDATVAGV
jgi:nicotinate dehydrogenase subunit B